MDFTFGIITGGHNNIMINSIIDSIESQNIPNYEIIIVGNSNLNRKNTAILPFDESIKSMWITKKKNEITLKSKYENIVYLHDYVTLTEGWYQGHLKAGNDFKVRMDKIINYDGKRFRDWCIWPHNGNKMDNIIGRECLIPYDIIHLSKYMYISGMYWVSKKNVMLEFPLDERLSWGEGEDVIWSKQIREKYNFNMNPHSIVKILKPNKDRVFDETSKDKIEILNNVSLWT